MANREPPGLTPEELALLDLTIMSAVQEGVPPDTPLSFTHAILNGLATASGALTIVVTVAVVMGTEKSAEGQEKLRRRIEEAFEDYARQNEVPELSLDELIELRRRLTE
jgi:hypothetical protein